MQAITGLRLGDEVDYCAIDDLWLPARVEDVGPGGSALRLRFQIGAEDVTHAVDLRTAARRRVAPAGYHSVPLMVGQPVDVLRKLGASNQLGASEQWLRGAWGGGRGIQ